MRAFFAYCGDLLRFLLASALLLWLAGSWQGAQRAWELQALPDFDAAAAARALAAESRHAEALMVLEVAEASPETAALRAEIEAERDAWQRWARQAVKGAWRGEGDTAVELGGAIAADLLVFGDVRDLVIQGGKALRGEPTDPLLIGLSTLGLALTVTPAADLGVAVLKFARRSGALGARLAGELLELSRRALRDGDAAPLRAVAADVGALSRRHAPGVTVPLLKTVERVDELPTLRRLGTQPAGAYALWAGGRPALRLALEQGEPGQRLLLRAARKGEAGLAYALRNSRILLRPHPLTGLAKGLYKGTLPRFLLEVSPATALLLLAAALAWWLSAGLRLASRVPGARARRSPSQTHRSAQDSGQRRRREPIIPVQ
jgi:hypothetical protein